MGERSAYDIIILADLRFPGGTSTAIAAEIVAQAKAGYRTGLLAVKAPVLRFPHPFHPRIRAAIDGGLCDLLDPEGAYSCGLLLIHHPQVLSELPARSWRITAALRLVVMHHPARDADGNAYYDWARIQRNATIALDAAPVWAPISPIVRDQMAAIEDAPPLLAKDWYDILDEGAFAGPRTGFVAETCLIGRHSRPDPLKWPDDRERILAVYPDDARFRVRVLGGGPFLHQLVGPYPATWEVEAFDPAAPQRFLRGIDFFVYYHHSRWVEAFGRSVIEAVAAGCVAILPPTFQSLLGEAAVYAEPRRAAATALDMHGSEAEFRRQSEAGVQIVRERFGPDAHVQRLRELALAPGKAGVPRKRRSPTRRRRLMLITSNGIGMGHLTRMLAIARRCPPALEPVFVTMSQAMRIVHDHGFHGEFLPFHQYLACDQQQWNHFLRLELREAIAFHDPAVIMFDGNTPYGGMVSAAREAESAWVVWSRRAMWRRDTGKHALDREANFDAVIEPGDLADIMDIGPTTTSIGRTRRVGPIRMMRDRELLGREAARRELGLEAGFRWVLVQLGSGNNFDYSTVRQRCVEMLLATPGVKVAMLQSPISDAPTVPPPGVRLLTVFPIARCLAAFDAVISAAGYNSYHELLLAGVPTLFVPNENPIMDDQLARAQFAERRQLALCTRVADIYQLRPQVERLLQPDVGRELAEAMKRLPRVDGGDEAARIIEEMAFTTRCDRAPFAAGQ